MTNSSECNHSLMDTIPLQHQLCSPPGYKLAAHSIQNLFGSHSMGGKRNLLFPYETDWHYLSSVKIRKLLATLSGLSITKSTKQRGNRVNAESCWHGKTNQRINWRNLAFQQQKWNGIHILLFHLLIYSSLPTYWPTQTSTSGIQYLWYSGESLLSIKLV